MYSIVALLIFNNVQRTLIVVTARYWVHLLFAPGTVPSKVHEFARLLFSVPGTQALSISVLHVRKLNRRVVEPLVQLVHLPASTWWNRGSNSSVWPQSPCSCPSTSGLEGNRGLLRAEPCNFMVLRPRGGTWPAQGHTASARQSQARDPGPPGHGSFYHPGLPLLRSLTLVHWSLKRQMAKLGVLWTIQL